MVLTEAKRLKELEAENAKSKCPLADMLLEWSAMEDVILQKWQTPQHDAAWSAICTWNIASASTWLAV